MYDRRNKIFIIILHFGLTCVTYTGRMFKNCPVEHSSYIGLTPYMVPSVVQFIKRAEISLHGSTCFLIFCSCVLANIQCLFGQQLFICHEHHSHADALNVNYHAVICTDNQKFFCTEIGLRLL